MRTLLLIGFLIAGKLAQAQRCIAEKEFEISDCQVGTGKCTLMTVNTDPNGREYIYRWNCGDGKTETGAKAEHCYENYGKYNVSLDLIDSKTGEVVKREVEKTVLLAEKPVITIPSRVSAGQEAELKYIYNAPSGWLTKAVYWSFGDGAFGCSNKGVHQYSTEGIFTVRVLVVGTLNGEASRVCSEMEIKVLPGNINGPLLLSAFESKEKVGIGGKRFLDEDAFLALLDSTGLKVVVVKRAGSHVPLNANTRYSVTAYKGNLYMPAVKFTAGLPGSEDDSLKEAIARLANQPVDSLPSFRFLLDDVEVSDGDIQKIVRFSNENQVAKINIGVYTHTGGRTGRNLSLSSKRATALKQALVRQGVAESRIRIFTAAQDMRLLNSCQGLLNCSLEQETYDRKAEFKISYEN